MCASHTRSNSTINLSDMIFGCKVRIDIRVCSCVVFVCCVGVELKSRCKVKTWIEDV